MDSTEFAELETEASQEPAAMSPEPATPKGRYNFAPPDQTMFDLMGVQLGECTRMVRTLADDIVDKPYTASEVGPMIQAFHKVVASSAIIADTMDMMHNGRPRADKPAPRKGGTF